MATGLLASGLMLFAALMVLDGFYVGKVCRQGRQGLKIIYAGLCSGMHAGFAVGSRAYIDSFALIMHEYDL